MENDEGIKYLKLKKNTICKNCLGCNKLEISYFKGLYKCKNFISGKTTSKQNWLINK